MINGKYDEEIKRMLVNDFMKAIKGKKTMRFCFEKYDEIVELIGIIGSKKKVSEVIRMKYKNGVTLSVLNDFFKMLRRYDGKLKKYGIGGRIIELAKGRVVEVGTKEDVNEVNKKEENEERIKVKRVSGNFDE